MKKYVCPICGYIYDEEKEGIPFDELPDNWVCPLCGASKNVFEVEKTEEDTVKVEEVKNFESEDLREMTNAEISALCSSLGRGCEKQYLEKEAEDFYKLASYYESKNQKNENNDFKDLIFKINEDLETNYKNARKIASDKNDRGALRVITWGEKVTMILKSLLSQYDKDKEFTKNTKVYVCDICGFIYVGDNKPEICPVCKVPSFKMLEIERGA